MRTFLFAILCAIACNAGAQQYAYVNADNLIVRSKAEKVYNVLVVLHAGYKLQVRPYIFGETKAQQAKYFFVSPLRGGDTTLPWSAGYVEKQYLVSSFSQVTALTSAENNDTSGSANRTLTDRRVTGRLRVRRPTYNYTQYPYPRYKGGEHSFPAPQKREYHEGPHGGCYYLDAKGHKKYVDRKYCK